MIGSIRIAGIRFRRSNSSALFAVLASSGANHATAKSPSTPCSHGHGADRPTTAIYNGIPLIRDGQRNRWLLPPQQRYDRDQ
ncbi:MAG: hypothetical protein IPH53_22690 [Flavobacteriales bacterium]|nr:hypothetical protein [Flavobacteriales bacterium]